MRKKLVKVRFSNKKKYVYLYPTHYELHETDKVKIINNNTIEKVEILDIFYKNLDDDRRFRYLEVYDPQKHKNLKKKKRLNINKRRLIKKVGIILLIFIGIALLVKLLNTCFVNLSKYYKNIGVTGKRDLLKHIYHYWTNDLSYFFDWFSFKINLYKSVIYLMLSIIIILFIIIILIKFIRKTITQIKIRKAEYKFKDIDNDFDYYLDHYFDDFDSFEEFLQLYLEGKMYKRNKDAFHYLNDKYFLFYRNGRRR